MRPGCRQEALKSSHSREGLRIQIWTCWSRWWSSGRRTGRWSDLPSSLESPLLRPTQGTSSTLGAKEDIFSWVKKWTKTHLNALFVEALYDLPLVLRDDARFLHVAKCGESLLHLHVEVSLTFRQEQESLVKCALEQSRVKDVEKNQKNCLVENRHCVLAMAQERRTSTAAHRHRVRLFLK